MFEQLDRWKTVIFLGGAVVLTRSIGRGDAFSIAVGVVVALVGLFFFTYRRWQDLAG
jgi:hypothetical protein